ncbi:MAG: hypothetical protein J6U54_14285 [Clostridiales bacterium]|nr:hypothetical protein [Clostridiales bacterium]
MTVHFVTNDKIALTSSKGNQEKWFENGRWYKLDQFGYEGLSETVISSHLSKSNIETDTPFTYVRYSPEKINAHGIERSGCSSANFLKEGDSIITLSRLFKSENISLNTTLHKLSSDKKRIAYLAEETAAITGLTEFPRYLTMLFEIDALFLNDDRHLNNIAVIKTPAGYDYCPIFDNGAGLLSNVIDHPLDISPEAFIKTSTARPFNTTFNRQIIHARNLYGPQLVVPKLSSKDIREVLEEPLLYYAKRDRGLIAERVIKTILSRQPK